MEAPSQFASPPAAEMQPEDFDSLVQDLMEHPENIMSADLTTEQLLEIQKRINPYARIAGIKSEVKQTAAISCTNLREEYLRRLTMTSLVGFINQVASEWDVPVTSRKWVPESVVKKEDTTPFDAKYLSESLAAIAAVAEEASLAATAATEALQASLEADLVNDLAAEQLAADSKLAAAKAAGLLYAATHATAGLGTKATDRLRATAEAGLKYPEVQAVLASYPLPPPAGEVEMPADLAKKIITEFIKNWFEFDPNLHVRSGLDAKKMAAAIESQQIGLSSVPVDTKDPGHLTIEALRSAAPVPAPEHVDAVTAIFENRKTFNAVATILRGGSSLADAAALAVANPETFAAYMFPVAADSAARPAVEAIPPQDTFHRWAYYTEVNYEELRTITEAIYPERADIDWALAVWATFEGTDEEIKEAFDKHCQRYQDEVPSSIKSVELGSWSLLADFKNNRDKIQFYNKNTEVLKRILERHADDKRIGAELMRNRVRQVKAKNISEAGPDAAGLKKYRQNNAEGGQDLASKGAEKVINAEEMRRLEIAKGNIKAAKELEILEERQKTIADLEAVAKYRKLTAEEAERLKYAKEDIPKIIEMLEVPDDTVQVDIFTNDTKSGTFTKTKFFTKADDPEDIASAKSESDQLKERLQLGMGMGR